jgi:hypothetical protein
MEIDWRWVIIKEGLASGTLRKVLCYGMLRYMEMSFTSRAGHPMDRY